MPVSRLKRVQLGQETTWGTSVAATAILMGVTDVSFTPTTEIYQAEQMGSLHPSSLTAQVKQAAEGSIDFDVTYEDICYLLDGVFGDCSPSGTESPYTWDYSAPTNATVTPREYTVEYGMTDAEYEVYGALFNEFSIEADIDGDGIWKSTIGVLAKGATTGTMASLSERSVELVKLSDTTLYLDTSGGTMGSTELSDSLISFTLDVNPGYHLKHFCGSINPADFGYSQWEGSLEVSFEYNSSVKAIVDDLIAGNEQEKQIQLKATSGTKQAQIDFCGHIVDPPELWDDRDGNATVTLNFQGMYNTTYGNWLAFQIKNATNALT